VVRVGIVLLLLLSISASAFPLELKAHKKPQTITFRIAAVTERVPQSSFSPNRAIYLGYMTGDNKSSKTVKIVFRYLGYEDGLSSEFVDFGLVHTFKALRDRSCDESWQSFSTKVVVGKDGNPLPVAIAKYAAPEAVQDIPADQVLPCYVITPQGYKSSKAVSIPQPNSQIADGR
jgi:hypothetical protein